METSINIKNIGYSQASSIVTKSKFDLFIERIEFSYFGIISMTILIGSMIGGITASMILNNDAPIWQLLLCTSVSMASNTAAIGQATTKWVVILFATNMVINIFLSLINIV